MTRSGVFRFAFGFGLLELVIALAVTAILMSIAFPSYRRFVLKSHRVEALQALLELQSAQERYFVQHNSYASSLSDPAPNGLGLSALTPGGYYLIQLESDIADGAGHFTGRAAARPESKQTEDLSCRSLTVNELGDRHAEDSAGLDRSAECWR